ncbi:hypothetical protein BsWGS_08086 [Bradybaena similaris]
MDIQGNFEPVFKMSRLGLGNSVTLPHPVKFRQVVYDPKLVEKELARADTESDHDSDISEAESDTLTEPSGQFFFKDPLQYPGYFQAEEGPTEQEAASAIKLGRNMRAGGSIVKKGGQKDIFKLMEEGQRLLDLLREQQTQQSKKAASEQMAGVLVNNLLINGFHIIPPESTPRPVDDSWTLPVSEDDKERVDNVVMGNQLIVDMHRELKRLQIN